MNSRGEVGCQAAFYVVHLFSQEFLEMHEWKCTFHWLHKIFKVDAIIIHKANLARYVIKSSSQNSVLHSSEK